MHPSEIYSQYEEVVVISDWAQVQCFTQSGWKLIDIKGTGSVEAGYQELQPATQQSANCPNCNSYHSCYRSTSSPETINGSVVLTKALFILGKKVNEVVNNLREKLKESEEQSSQRYRDYEDLVKRSDEKHEENKRLRVANTHSESDRKRLQGLLDAEKEKTEKAIQDANRAKKFMGQDNWDRYVVDPVD